MSGSKKTHGQGLNRLYYCVRDTMEGSDKEGDRDIGRYMLYEREKCSMPPESSYTNNAVLSVVYRIVYYLSIHQW